MQLVVRWVKGPRVPNAQTTGWGRERHSWWMLYLWGGSTGWIAKRSWRLNLELLEGAGAMLTGTGSPSPIFWSLTSVFHQMIASVSAAATAAKLLQSCPTLCDPIDGSPPGSPVPGILQARTLEWVAISFSNAWKWKAKGKLLSRVRLSATPWTAAYQAPPSMGLSRQEYWSGVPLPSPKCIWETWFSESQPQHLE